MLASRLLDCPLQCAMPGSKTDLCWAGPCRAVLCWGCALPCCADGALPCCIVLGLCPAVLCVLCCALPCAVPCSAVLCRAVPCCALPCAVLGWAVPHCAVPYCAGLGRGWGRARRGGCGIAAASTRASRPPPNFQSDRCRALAPTPASPVAPQRGAGLSPAAEAVVVARARHLSLRRAASCQSATPGVAEMVRCRARPRFCPGRFTAEQPAGCKAGTKRSRGCARRGWR